MKKRGPKKGIKPRTPYGTKAYRAAVSTGMRSGVLHPFVREAIQWYGSVNAWAKLRGVPSSTAYSWVAAWSTKSIPRKWADLIASEFVDEKSGKSLVPATLKTWPNGIL